MIKMTDQEDRIVRRISDLLMKGLSDEEACVLVAHEGLTSTVEEAEDILERVPYVKRPGGWNGSAEA